MSIFKNIMGRIFGHAQAATPNPQAGATTASPPPAATTTSGASQSGANPGITAQQATATTAPGSQGGAAAAPNAGEPRNGAGTAAPGASNASAQAGTTQPVDVEAVLSELAAKNPQKLNWRTSIVDLLKLLDLDSGLAERKELARELNYTGDTNDSAAMNIWLHKQVMRKLAENGGKVPDDLKN